MEETKVYEIRVLKDEGETFVCAIKLGPEGRSVHIPDDPEFQNLVDFEEYLDAQYGDMQDEK